MAKNKGTYGRGRSQVEETDEFVEGVGEVVETLKPHSKGLIAVGILAASGLLGYGIFSWHINKERAEASMLYSDALRLAYLPIDDSVDSDDSGSVYDDRPKSFPSEKARDTAVAAALDSLKSEFPGSGIYNSSRFLHAQSYTHLGKFDQANTIFSAISSDSSGADKVAALEGLAAVAEAQADAAENPSDRETFFNKALEQYQKVADASANAPSEETQGRAKGHYNAARMYAALGKNTEAISQFEEALKVEPDTWLKQAIEERVEVLKRAKQ